MNVVELTYMGRVQSNAREFGISYKYVNSATGIFSVFTTKIADCKIGTIISCNETENGVKGPYEIVGIHMNSDDIYKWQNRDIAVYDELQAIKFARNNNYKNHEKAIVSMRNTYKELTANQKLVFINRLIMDITKYQYKNYFFLWFIIVLLQPLLTIKKIKFIKTHKIPNYLFHSTTSTYVNNNNQQKKKRAIGEQ